jgi:hypothetical protein
LNLETSMIELVRGGYKLESDACYVIIPHKWWSGSPFIACRGRGLIVSSLIVLRQEYTESSRWPSRLSPLRDLGSYHFAVAHHIILSKGICIPAGPCTLLIVACLIGCIEGHMLGCHHKTCLSLSRLSSHNGIA